MFRGTDCRVGFCCCLFTLWCAGVDSSAKGWSHPLFRLVIIPECHCSGLLLVRVSSGTTEGAQCPSPCSEAMIRSHRITHRRLFRRSRSRSSVVGLGASSVRLSLCRPLHRLPCFKRLDLQVKPSPLPEACGSRSMEPLSGWPIGSHALNSQRF